MTTINHLNRNRSTALRRSERHTAPPVLAGVGTATPPYQSPQLHIAHELAAVWNLAGNDLARWHRISAATGIDQRCGVLPIGQAIDHTTAGRMVLYEQHAPPLAAAAAQAALNDAQIATNCITDLIVVSCTGFAAPGVDVALCESLGLSPTVRRCMIGFMGCFGAITGLRSAHGACTADPNAVALVVCVELCSLHVRRDRGMDNQVACALFADGAAAAVVAGNAIAASHGQAGHRTLSVGHTRLLSEGRDWMTWRVSDAGFAMTLDREVPRALHGTIDQFVQEACSDVPETFIVHPGGPGILDAVNSGLRLSGCNGLEASRHVLKSFGNMSSATVLFVLKEAIERRLPAPMMLLAFGPGLTIESINIT